MAGFLGDFGNWLIQDPNAPPGASQASGGLLGAGTPTASTQTPTQPSSGVPYALQPIPQSRLGILLQGILSGLGTTGYKGSAAVGAGANAALEGQMRQRQLNAQTTMMGQEYQRGQQGLQAGRVGLAENYANLAITAARLNDMTGRTDITPDMLLNHPEMASAIMGAPMPQTGQPLQQSQQAPTNVGMQPIVNGQPDPNQTPMNPNVQQAYGTNPNAPAQTTQQPTQQPQQNSAPADPTLTGLKRALQEAYLYSPDKVPTIQAQIAEYQGSVQHAADIETAKSNATFNAPAGFSSNMQKLASDYSGEQSVKTMREVRPIYNEIVAAADAGSKAKTPEEELPSDMDLANGVLKMMNPNNANLRPNTAESIEEAKGVYNLAAKAKQALIGGSGLSKEVRQTLIDVAKKHMAQYQADYDTTHATYQKRAGMYGKNVDEGLWNSDYRPQAAAGVQTATNPQTGERMQLVGGQWQPLQ